MLREWYEFMEALKHLWVQDLVNSGKLVADRVLAVSTHLTTTMEFRRNMSLLSIKTGLMTHNE